MFVSHDEEPYKSSASTTSTVWRERQRKKTGCLRCRRRHKKCDEIKPKCSYCNRWSLTCVWPDLSGNASRATRKDTATTVNLYVPTAAVTNPVSICRPPPGESHAFDPFHELPFFNNSQLSSTTRLLQYFFVSITDQNLPYDAAQERLHMVRGLLESVFIDEAVCSACVTYRAKCMARHTDDSQMRILGLQGASQTSTVLRQRIESGSRVTEESLLAAAVHFIAVAVDIGDRRQLRGILQGVSALLKSAGGVDVLMQQMKQSTILSVLTCDLFNSMLNADPHVFARLDRPPRPSSLSEVYIPSPRSTAFDAYVDSEVVAVFEDLRLLLYFRYPSEQRRALLANEASYIRAIGQYIDYRLGVLQSAYIGQGSLSELIVLVSMIVRQEIVAQGVEHPMLITTLLDRLRNTVNSCLRTNDIVHRSMGIWACCMALSGETPVANRVWFSGSAYYTLLHTYGNHESLPPMWKDDLRQRLREVLWHSRIAGRFPTICVEIQRWGVAALPQSPL